MDLVSAGPRGAVVVGESAGRPVQVVGVGVGCYSSESQEVGTGVGDVSGRRWSCGGEVVDLVLQARRALRLLPLPESCHGCRGGGPG